MQTKIKEQIERWTKVLNYYEHSDFFKTVETEDRKLFLNTFSRNLQIIVKNDYQVLLQTLKEVAKELGALQMSGNWYSCGEMLFIWRKEFLEVRFDCKPENIPAELMPSTSCKVVKEVIESENYSIVCEVKND